MRQSHRILRHSGGHLPVSAADREAVERQPPHDQPAVADPAPTAGWRRAGSPAGPAVVGVVVAAATSLVSLAGSILGRPGAALLVAGVTGVAAAMAAATIGRVSLRAATAERSLARARAGAELDGLTGLPGRAAVIAAVEARLEARDRRALVGVLVCGLDRLDAVNDALGHEAGDEVIRVAAQRIRGIVRDTDTVGRIGSDRFVVVPDGLPTARDLQILADRLNEALRRPTALAGEATPVVPASIGIAHATGEGEATAGDLLRDADAARSRASAAGGDRSVMFDAAERAEAVARLRLEQELRVAIDDGQVAVHYQPIVDSRSGAVDRLEALIRWDHPRRGTVLPGEFLPVAAESRLIVDLGRFVLVEACRQAVEWSERYERPISVAVNVAERQLLDLGLVEVVTRALATTGLPAAQLQLEVSEDVLLDRLDHCLVALRQLDLLGVELAIDDFGTSQASLGRLKGLAMVSTLKIDRVFVADLATGGPDGVDRKIVAAIVALASSVGMAVVAEGVETAGQAELLRELGVDQLQGFLFERPGPAAALESVLAAVDARVQPA